MKKNKFIFDMCLNIFAVAIPVGILQLVVYPITAKNIGADNYGFMLTIYSVWMMISNSLGNVLNNIRLLRDKEYQGENPNGDFTLLFNKWGAINAVVISAIVLFYCGGFSYVHLNLGVFASLLVLTKSYFEVGFRLKLNYKSILITSVLQGIGFVFGTVITCVTGVWEFIFIFGYLFCSIYSFHKTKLYERSKYKTENYVVVNHDVNKLIFATIISNMMNYADKLVLYPLMGGYSVSIYYTATILGKILGMLTGPINSVILSYISRWSTSKKNILNKVILVGGVLCIGCYAMTVLLYRPVISILFPQWVDEVIKYIPITTVTVCLTALVSMIQPFVLKFCDMKWQIVINAVSVVVYFTAALVLWNLFGLMGFCIGAMIGMIVKLLIMIFIYYGTSKLDKNKMV